MKVTLWSAVALALFGALPAWAQQSNGMRVVGHFDPPLVPVPGGSPSDRHSLIAEEPLDSPPAVPSLDNNSAAAPAHGSGPAPYANGSGDINYSSGQCNNGGYQGGCCDNGCQSDCCCGPGLLDCCQVCPPSGWNAEIGFYFLKPHWQTNQAFAVATVNGGTFNTQNVDFDYNYSVSPFIALGYTLDNGLGFKVRYWDFQDSANANVATGANQFAASAAPLGVGTFLNPNTTATAASNLRLKVWDFEISQRLNCNCWVWNFGGGFRYLHTSQANNTVVNGAANAVDDLTSSHRFKGVGPTLSLSGQRYLGCTGLSLYGNGRASVLVGDSTQTAQLSAANGTQGNSALQSNWGTLAVTELEVGVSYQRTFGCFTMVGSTGLVGQYWSGIGNSSNVDTFSFATDETPNNSLSMAMYGLRASLAFYY